MHDDEESHTRSGDRLQLGVEDHASAMSVMPASSRTEDDDPYAGTKFAGMVHHPCPLRPGCMAFLYLPHPLTREDVTRIVAMLDTLVVPEAGR